MTLKEAMSARHTVRKYKSTPLPADIVRQLNERIDMQNREHTLSIQLVTDNTDALPGIISRTMTKGVRNYMILAGPNAPETDEKLGYSSADLMLYAQTLGLNTWWVGGMYSHKGARRNLNAPDSKKIIGVVVVGYGEEQGVAHKSKNPEAVSLYAGDPPAWFKSGVAAALLAPTAMNKQAFSIKGQDHSVTMTYEKGSFSGADLGICKYHFELGAGMENFIWK